MRSALALARAAGGTSARSATLRLQAHEGIGMDTHSAGISPKLIAAVVVALALLGALFASSYHTTAQLDATFKAAGINPNALQPDHPVGKAPPRG
jgi:hypothetical protein